VASVRTVKAASGATAVQIVWSSRRGSRQIEHVGSAHDDPELEALKDQTIYYQFRADRARRTMRGIDEQVAKAAKAVAGLAPVKRDRFIALDGATKSVNRELEVKARDLTGLKGYATNLAACPDGTPAGPSGSSSAPPAATAPSRSAPASTPSQPKTRSRPTSATPSP
jgi:hypothetical protein